MPPFRIALDHFVLTVQDVEATVRWYERVLGMRRWETTDSEGAQRTALYWSAGSGQWNKINVHPAGAEFEPHAKSPIPGSTDLCFTVSYSAAQLAEHLAVCGVPIEIGPVARTGSLRPLQSIYVRDPDGNLIELAEEIGDRFAQLTEWEETTTATTIS